MRRLRRAKFALVMAAMAALIAGPASASTTHFTIEYSDEHDCTHEQVIGDTRVSYSADERDNGDGTTTVTIRQHVHGSHLVGVFSGDKYVLNEQRDTVETFTLSTSLGGTVTTKTTFIHYTERQAFMEVPGEDDLHQYLTFTFMPIGDPVLTEERTECR